MNKNKNSTAFVIALITGLFVSAAGCDLQRVDKGAEIPIATLIADLSAAEDAKQAERTIELLLQKTEIGVAYKAGLYDGYAFKGGELSRLAMAQAAFVETGAHEVTGFGGATLSAVYHEVINAKRKLSDVEVSFRRLRQIEASLELALEVLEVSGRHALSDPEESENSLILAITSDPRATSPGVNSIAAERILSPVQRLLFGVWLHKNGPRLEATLSKLSGSSSSSCPIGTSLLAKFEFQGGQFVFEKPAGNESVVTFTSATAESADWTSTEGVEAVVLKGGAGTGAMDVISYDPAVTAGSFDNSNLQNAGGQTTNISNVHFCGPDSSSDDDEFQLCLEDCEERRQVCLLGGCECDGGIAVLTLQYLGADANIRVDRSPKGGTPFDGFLATGEVFIVDGAGLGGPSSFQDNLRTNLNFFVNGAKADQIHTSCSDPRVKPGFVSDGGLFEVLEVTDVKNNVCRDADNLEELCEIEYKLCVNECHDQGGAD